MISESETDDDMGYSAEGGIQHRSGGRICGQRSSCLSYLLAIILLLIMLGVAAMIYIGPRLPANVYRSCKHAKDSGITTQSVTVMPDGTTRFLVKCNHKMGSGGWTVIQYRDSQAVNFDRTWVHYKRGFGRLKTNHWLGNDKIRLLTKDKDQVLLVYFLTSSGEANATFSRFYLGPENDDYRMHYDKYLGGNYGLNLTENRGEKFSTLDRDNDRTIMNCARIFGGGWWYGGTEHCGHTFLNSRWKKDNIKWISTLNERSYFGSKTSMMIR